MRLVTIHLLAAAALTACSGSGVAGDSVASIPEPKEWPPEGSCSAEAVSGYTGQQATQAAAAEILTQSGAKVLRWGPPDSVWTMDYREDRVNVRYDRAMIITTVTCG